MYTYHDYIKMKILLTGSAGFIGYHLAKSLLKQNYEVVGIDNLNNYYDVKLKKKRLERLYSYNSFNFIKLDLVDKKLLSDNFRRFDPQLVVNLAAQAGVSYSIANPYAYLKSNLSGFLNLIECCRNFRVDGLIYASSSSIYGLNDKIPFSENDKSDSPIALYGATKKANELIAHSYSHLYDLNTTGLRYFTVYGPWYRPDMAMYIFIKKIINDEKITVYNDGNIFRDFTYIDDIIRGTVSAIQKNYNCELFNLGNNKKVKLLDLINLIEDSLGKKAKVEFEALKKGDMLETYADIKHAQEKLNYLPRVDISSGIPKLVKWFKEYHQC